MESLLKNCKMTVDESAAELTRMIREKEPFFFVRYGDGALECIHRKKSQTCDGEVYSIELGEALLSCWNSLLSSDRACVGDWLSASFNPGDNRYEDWYRELVGTFAPRWFHFESLLFMRESEELVDFYRAVRKDERKKVLVGPAQIRPAAVALGAQFINVPMTSNLYQHRNVILDLLRWTKFDVVLYGAGMAGSVPMIRCWEEFPDRTYVNIGSALDPLFRGRTRKQQLSKERAWNLFNKATE